MTPTRSRFLAAAALAALATQFPALAQLENLPPSARTTAVEALDREIAAAGATPMAAHLKRAKAAQGDRAVLASRVAADFDRADQDFVHYAVPAMSNVQRLPDLYPTDGRAGRPVRIFAAKGEYEPGSFLVYPLRDLGKVAFDLTPFRTADGKVFPADRLDLKMIKVWYQNRNAWYSYFGDTGFKLVPELLLNDEDLIRVDTGKKANYARLRKKDGTVVEQWINPPRAMDHRIDDSRNPCCFLPMREDFRDAETLQPVLLEEGAFRNFFLTSHVTKEIPEGLYRGGVRLTGEAGREIGTIPVEIRVFPFELPAPKCYLNPEKDYLTASYSYLSIRRIMSENGGDIELAKRQFEAVLRDQVAHSQFFHWLRGKGTCDDYLMMYEMMKKAGMRTDVIIGGPDYDRTSEKTMRADAIRLREWCDKHLGHHDVRLQYGDEPGPTWLVNARPIFKAYQREGFKFIIAGANSVFFKAGHVYNWHNISKDPTDSSSTHLWNQLDNAHIAWHARMHVGPENPAYNRMQYGIAPYLAGYSATCNYAHHFGPYNDDSTVYRPMVFAYGISDGVIDTIQWEGYREGIDDIRYATLMTSLARKAARSPVVETRYAGLKALQHLAMLDYKHGADLDANRLEMIRHILLLRDHLAIR